MSSGKTDLAFTAGTLNHVEHEPTYSGVTSFLRRKHSRSLEDADVAVFGVPMDIATTNRPGARFGPGAVRAASAVMAWERPYGWDFDTREVLKIVDYGDLIFDFATPHEMTGDIEKQVAAIAAAGVGTLALGGDHYITYPILRALHALHGPLSLIHFDAHSDTWEDQPGRLYDHGTMFRHAAEEGLIVPERSVQIGLRTHNPDTMGFQILDAPWVHEHGPAAVAAEARRIVGDHKAYLTFDIDCLDPAYAPGTGTPVSGGLSSGQALAILHGLAGVNIIGGDVVEVAPAYDNAQVTALAGAHIACDILGLYACRPGGPVSPEVE